MARRRPRRRLTEESQLGFGGLFKGMGNLLDLISQMAEEGDSEYFDTGEIKGPGGKARGVYGFSVKMGRGGQPVVEEFGNIKATDRGPVVAEVREPIVDVFDEDDVLVVIAELPGVENDDLRIEVKGDILELSAEAKERKYSKEVLLPSRVDAKSIESSYKNGVLELRLKKI